MRCQECNISFESNRLRYGLQFALRYDPSAECKSCGPDSQRAYMSRREVEVEVKKVESKERGDSHTAIAVGGDWVKVSDLPNAMYEGRDAGWEIYSAEVPVSTLVGNFYRSGSGKTEKVELSDGRGFRSFQAAECAISDDPPNPLGAFTIENLREEIERRGDETA